MKVQSNTGDMDKMISDFIATQTVASVCCLDEDNHPYCFSCFYAYDREEHMLYFKTSPASHHVKLLLKHPLVAGTIQPDRLNTIAVKGLQFEGVAYWETGKLPDHASLFYHLKHPMAIAMDGDIWRIQLYKVKMTDNTLGHRKKLSWECSKTTRSERDHHAMKASHSH
jgi:uncharacterized protein